MTLIKNAVITALGGYVPEHILDNGMLENIMDTSDQWITTRTGIKERRILKDEMLATSDMATFAITDLLKNHNVKPEEIECLIVATSTPDHLLLPTSSTVCNKAGLINAWGMDINAACSGFLFALSTGAALIESGRYKKVIVVGADQMSAIVNYDDRNTSILFGDGAGAVLLEQTEEQIGIIDNVFKTDGNGGQYLYVPGGGSRHPATTNTVNQKMHYVHQEGKTVFKAAINGMSQTCNQILERNTITAQDVDWLVPHQANIRIIQGVGERLNIPTEKVKINIEKYGNTTAGTIPLCLWDFKNDFSFGDKILLTAFGAGFTWGTTYIKWGELRK